MSLPKRRRITDRGPGASSLPALVRTCVAKLVGTGGDGRKQSGEVGRRNRVCGAGKIGQRSHSPGFAESRSKGLELHAGFRNFFASIGGAQNGADGSAANPVRGTFVADGKSPASGAGGSSLRVAAIGDGTCARNDNDARASVECSFERDLHVADHINRSGENFGQGSGEQFRPIPGGQRRNLQRKCGKLVQA